MTNFDQITHRQGTGSLKWDEDPQVEFPLWVADMDFEVCPAILDAMKERVEHGIFGYVNPTDSYYQSVIHWHKRRHGVNYQREWIITVPGIVPAISAILKAMTKSGDGVLLLSPTYNCFYSSIKNLGCRKEESVLKEVNDTYEIDWEDLEIKAAQPDVSVMLLCSPHNPCGRIWRKEELMRIADICLKNHVLVIADEIHCELVMPGQEFISYATLGEPYLQNLCLCTSASKAFNIAGLQNAQIIIPNPTIRRRVDRAVNIHEVCDVNPFGVIATEAAYTHGEEWLNELCEYIWGNYEVARNFIQNHIPQLKVKKLEGTYLMWVDISAVNADDEAFCESLKASQSVWYAAGSHYGKGGKGYIRINLATQRVNVQESLKRMKVYIETVGVKS